MFGGRRQASLDVAADDEHINTFKKFRKIHEKGDAQALLVDLRDPENRLHDENSET